MLLSIIVPTYNVETYLGNCLESLVNQNLKDDCYEIIVVNDGATDSSPEIAVQYEKKYAQIWVHHQENQGLSAARNKGISLAKGKYIYFIDSDDYIAENTLKYALDLLEKHQLDVLGLRVKNTASLGIKATDNPEIMQGEPAKVTDGITYIAENNYLNNAWWYFINREFLLNTKLQFPVGRFVEDANFTAQLLCQSRRIMRSSLDFYRYVIRPNSIMRRRSKTHTKKMIADYEKNVYDFQKQLEGLRKNEHSRIKECLERLEARQQAFVFFLIIKAIKNGTQPSELEPILEGFRKIGVYPLNRFLGKDYHKLQYKLLQPIMNNKLLLWGALGIFRLINGLFFR